MAIIKYHEAESALKRAVVLDMGDLRRQAAQIMAEAKASARRIVAEAEQQQQRIATQAHEVAERRGHAEGLEKGLEEGRRDGHAEALAQSSQQIQKLLDTWMTCAEGWQTRREQMDREARTAVLQFALRLAERVVHRAIEVDDQVIVEQVASALSHVLRPTDVSVRIHPDDHPALETALGKLTTALTQLKHVHLVDDPNIERGGCLVTYGQGQIDATVDRQLQRIAELILPEQTQEPPEPPSA